MLEILEPKQKAALISFVSRSLEYLAGAASHIKPLVTIIVDYAIDCARDTNTSVWQDVSQFAQCCVERRDFVRSIVVKQLVSEFGREHLDRSEAIHEALSQFDLPHRYLRPERQKLPPELSFSVREELKPFILERIQNSAFHAAVAWEWYGVFDRSLLIRHGIATYFNTKIGDYEDLDGLSAIALAASQTLRIIAPDHITRRKATDALEWIGTIGFSAVPLPKQQFRVNQKGGISLGAWSRIIRHGTSSPEATAGYLFAMMVATELQGRTEDEEVRSVRRKVKSITRREIIEWAFANLGMQKLKVFPQIKAAAEAKSLFV
jgi:hypothetical protein